MPLHTKSLAGSSGVRGCSSGAVPVQEGQLPRWGRAAAWSTVGVDGLLEEWRAAEI